MSSGGLSHKPTHKKRRGKSLLPDTVPALDARPFRYTPSAATVASLSFLPLTLIDVEEELDQVLSEIG